MHFVSMKGAMVAMKGPKGNQKSTGKVKIDKRSGSSVKKSLEVLDWHGAKRPAAAGGGASEQMDRNTKHHYQ